MQNTKKAPRSLVRPLPSGSARTPVMPTQHRAKVPGAGGGGLIRPLSGRVKY